MKVKDLITKAHLFGSQKITLSDRSTAQTLTTSDRYYFDVDSEEAERIFKLKVNSFEVGADGIKIWAE